MAPAWLGSLHPRLRRGVNALTVAIALLAQGVVLPWHLATEHHGHHGHQDLGAHSAEDTHEHPNLPVDHDEDDHEYSSVLAASQSRQRVSDPSDVSPPLHATAAVSLDVRLCAATREFLSRSHEVCGHEAVPLLARGARAPPAARGAFCSLCEPG